MATIRKKKNNERKPSSVDPMPPDPEEENKQLFLTALRKRYGIILIACSDTGIAEKEVTRWLATDESFSREVATARERMLDFVEAKMFEKIGSGNERLIRFYLETQGKDRGYVKRRELADATSLLPSNLCPEELLMFSSEQKEDEENG